MYSEKYLVTALAFQCLDLGLGVLLGGAAPGVADRGHFARSSKTLVVSGSTYSQDP